MSTFLLIFRKCAWLEPLDIKLNVGTFDITNYNLLILLTNRTFLKTKKYNIALYYKRNVIEFDLLANI